MKSSFTKRILFFLFLVIPVPLVLNLVMLTLFSYSAVKNDLLQSLYTRSANFSLEFEKKLLIHKVFLKRLTNSLSLKSYTTAAEDFYNEAFNEMLALPDENFSICWITPTDHIIKTKNPRHPFIRYLKTHPELKTKLYRSIGKACLISIPNEHFFVIVEDIEILNSSENAGLLVAYYPMSFLQKDITRPTFNQESISCLNKHGEVLFSSDSNLQYKTFSSSLPDIPILASKRSAIPFTLAPKFMNTPNLIHVSINGKGYFGLILNKLPIQGIFTLTLVPVSSFYKRIIILPLNVSSFYLLSFFFMGFIFSKINKRLNLPIQELTTCMEATWRGNHNIRYEPQPYGYEINELGNIFNCTLLLLLNSKEKAEIEYMSGSQLQKELSLLSILQDTLLTPPLPSLPQATVTVKKSQTRQLTGYFYGWKVLKDGFLGVIGLAGEVGLPSYLYALSARSLFLSYAHLFPSLEVIAEKTFQSFRATTEASISMVFIHYEPSSISLINKGLSLTNLCLLRNGQRTSLILPTTQQIQPGDCLICAHNDEEVMILFTK